MNLKQSLPAIMLGAVAFACVLSIGSNRLTADMTSDCSGKIYGTPGCPVFSSSSSSSIPASCGNTNVDIGEQCDHGFSNGKTGDSCSKSCTFRQCSDGTVSPDLGEECEPTYHYYYIQDPASGNLTLERRFDAPQCGTYCTVPSCTAAGICSGGCKRQFLAECTSSSAAPVQASSSAQTSAVASSEQAVSLCGNSKIDAGEQCDDGPRNSDARSGACRTDCILSTCGDNTIDPGEECDNGPRNSDTLANACRLKCTLAHCGDGIVDQGEQCDVGTFNSDAAGTVCRLNCQLPRCGDGVVDKGEQCDDGPRNSDARSGACRTDCVLPLCGDGIIDSGEDCDDGARNSNNRPNACRLTCKLTVCGDGVIDKGEECDDSNHNDLDGCTNICTLPRCGDGIKQANEQCDDGVRNSDALPNTCRTTCTTPRCGDNVIDRGEECDGGALCTPSCTAIQAAATTEVPSNTGSGALIGILSAVVVLGVLGGTGFAFRKKIMALLSPIVPTKLPNQTIDDIPLNEIEMPWGGTNTWKK